MKRAIARRLIRPAIFILALAAALPISLPPTLQLPAAVNRALPSLSPLVATMPAIAARSFSWWLLLSLLLLLCSLRYPRWFCHWACPT